MTQSYNDNLRKLPNEYGDVSVMLIEPYSYMGHMQIKRMDGLTVNAKAKLKWPVKRMKQTQNWRPHQ